MKEKIFDTNKLTDINTKIHRGVEEITVDLVSCTENPYKNMCEMALATWGSSLRKWNKISPDERFKVALKVLQRKALPLGKESPSFLFGISGVTRSSFDQIARQRIGSTFASLGWNNIHSSTGFRINNEILNHDDSMHYYYRIERLIYDIKKLYSDLINDGVSWQSARELLPLGLLHWFYFSLTYEALLAFCSRRLCFSEKEDTVAVAWLMRERVREKFPLLASFLRPSCDWSKRCLYHSEDSIPEEMGTLFEPCGRNPCLVKNINVDFDRPSTDVNDLINQLKIIIPRCDEQVPVLSFGGLDDLDVRLFNAD